MIDTLLGGRPGITAAYLVHGPRPALVDPGAATTAGVVRDALTAAGIGPEDLGWIVPTHVHLDHCGATGALARAFPSARVVVHERGARHLAEPARLVAATAAVHGPRAPLYGGLDPTPAARITAAADGHRLDVGDGRVLRVLHTPGHARHHACLLEEASGALIAGDAAGTRLAGGGLYPALPPPEVDPAAGDASLARVEALRPSALLFAHHGPSPDPAADLALARDQLARCAAAARDAGDAAAVAAALDRVLPLAATVGVPDAVEAWEWVGWAPSTADGLALWAARERARQ